MTVLVSAREFESHGRELVAPGIARCCLGALSGSTGTAPVDRPHVGRRGFFRLVCLARVVRTNRITLSRERKPLTASVSETLPT